MSEPESRILIYAPTGRDATITEQILRDGGIAAQICPSLDALCGAIAEGVGAVLTTAEALDAKTTESLTRALGDQPAWSEVPVLLFAPEGRSERTTEQLGPRAYVTLLDRPIHIKTLLSVARSALRTRSRQYQIRSLMANLEERVQERDRFLAILGHELRNPLGAILLGAQMLDPESGKLDGDHARMIERQARHLTRLVNDLLDLSRVVSGKIVIQPEVLDLRDTVSQVLAGLRDSAESQGLSLHLDVPKTPVCVEADPVRIDQIAGNLLTNSIKYTPDGGRIDVTVRKDGDEAVLEIADTGVGISPERIGRIFELFAQAENAIGRSQGGMGIGLALVRNLVELHGGSVSADSDGDGHGSRFVVRLPISAGRIRKPVEPEKTTNGKPRGIVIVEDNVDVREVLRLRLSRLGHRVDVAGDGVAGVDTILEVRPDLALIDIGLPGMDGYDVARTVREKVGRGIVLVALSGFGQADDKRKAFEAGFDEHLTKPADVGDLQRMLERFPSRASGHDVSS